MNRRLVKVTSLMLVITLLVVSSLVGCGKKAETEETTISIGLLVPLSGPAAAGYSTVVAMYDMTVAYINAEEPIPGVKLELLKYDTKYDPAQSIPGYTWLKGQGAKFIVTDAVAGETLKNTADADKFPLFLIGGTSVAIENPGYVFCTQPLYYQEVQGFLKWLGDSWGNYPTKPKIGCFGWSGTWGDDFAKGGQDYCQAHPDNFTWVGKYVAPYGTNSWFAEVEALKDCDYIICGAFAGGAATFINAFRAKGYNGKFVGDDPWGSFWPIYVASCGKAALDGTLILSGYGPYLVDSQDIDSLMKHVFDNYSTAENRKTILDQSWSGDELYAIPMLTIVWSQAEMLREAVKSVEDPADLTGEMIYEAATTQQLNIEGLPAPLGYSATKRVLMPYRTMYEYSIAGGFHVVSDWITIPGYE